MDKLRKRMAYRLLWLSIAALVAMEVLIQLRVHGGPSLRGHAALGYAPNLLAAFALPFCFHGLMVFSGRRDDGSPYGWAQLWRENAAITASVALSVGGLVLWEFIQVTRPNRTYDPQDIAATLAVALAFLLVVLVGRILTRHAQVGPLHVPINSVSQ